jgi:putative sigma-54 modulation protein
MRNLRLSRRESEERRLTMEVEFTARQVKISKALRTHAEEGMERIGRILGKSACASIMFSTQRHVQIVELTVQGRAQKIAATGKAATLDAALREAMEHAENQARRYRDRRMGSKRLPKEEKVLTAPPVARPKARAAQPPADGEEAKTGRAAGTKARASIAVHSFPSRATVVEPHILKNGEAIALKPLTIEEAVKEAEFRDRDLLIFHTNSGDMFVLHRRRDGQMELVEIP